MDAIDGIDLKRFFAGGEYDVGPSLATFLITEGWAIPLDPSDTDTSADAEVPYPPNLVREIFPPYYDGPASLALDRRKSPRKR
ncbi:MAG TPA: hypothetical protein VHZ73_11265 [Vicinamibacterales bacterium]|nr:hypothetical protein [Vicinamibacterales bacterium]